LDTKSLVLDSLSIKIGTFSLVNETKEVFMPIEQYTESLVLQEMKCTLGENAFGFVFPQGDVSSVDKLEKLLKKAGGKPTICQLVDYSQGGNGKAKPEFLITFNKQSNTIIVVECKNSTKKHTSENLDCPKGFAVDGVLYYAKFLKESYNVIAIAVSGTKKDSVKVNAYYWHKNQETYTELKKARDVIYDPENYLRIVSGEAVKKSISIEDIQNLALEMHESLRSLAVTERAKPVFIAGVLIALKDDDFLKEYINLVSFKSLLNRLQDAINNVLKDSDVRSDKIDDIRNHFTIIGKNTKLKSIPLGHYNSLSWYIEELEKKIKPMMDYADNTIDALGIFYHEFVKYSGGDGSGLGIVLTPQHLTEFMCDLAGVNKNSKVVDICCGSGTFLVTAMGKMFKGANDKEIEKIRQNALFGVESDDDIYTLAIANMIVRGDGKSNIIYGDCFNKKTKEELTAKNINIGLINPPYSQDTTELEFVENMLDVLIPSGTGVVVVPISCAIGTKFKEIRERLFKKHTLKAVFSMPDDIFYSNNANTNVCVMVWEAHKSHDTKKNTFFGYYKDDGFVKAKKLGRIDKFNKWKSIEAEWLRLYQNLENKDGLSVKKSVNWNDEWLCEAYMETDYSVLTQNDFQKTVNNYLAYLVKSEN
jgi:type I restriction-modification system DNA methylase subunit